MSHTYAAAQSILTTNWDGISSTKQAGLQKQLRFTRTRSQVTHMTSGLFLSFSFRHSKLPREPGGHNPVEPSPRVVFVRRVLAAPREEPRRSVPIAVKNLGDPAGELGSLGSNHG